MLRCALLLFGLIVCHEAHAQQASPIPWDDPQLALKLPQEMRQKYYNFTNPGSCVQCSIGMCGMDQNVPAAAYLLEQSEYGAPVFHGSNPSRVAKYCKDRNIRVYNVTGSKTWDWMRWACNTGRACAIGAGGSHFQTLVGYIPPKGDEPAHWIVCNNNGDQKYQDYSEAAFRRLHLASGQWCVILDYPPSPAPGRLVEWWK